MNGLFLISHPVFREELAQADLPMAIRDVRLATDPLDSTAKGCLMAAINDQEELGFGEEGGEGE